MRPAFRRLGGKAGAKLPRRAPGSGGAPAVRRPARLGPGNCPLTQGAPSRPHASCLWRRRGVLCHARRGGHGEGRRQTLPPPPLPPLLLLLLLLHAPSAAGSRSSSARDSARVSGGESDKALRLRRKKHGMFTALAKSTVTSCTILSLGGVQATAKSERVMAKRVPSGEECLICQIGATWAMTLGNTRTVVHLLSVTAALLPLGAPDAPTVNRR